jgi:penicillin-binding protein 1B
MEVGLERIIDVIKRMGVARDVAAIPALSLGAVELSPFEVAQMYQVIAANGYYSPLRAIRAITGQHGDSVKRYPLQVDKRFDSVATSLLQFGLQEVMNRGTGKSVYAKLPKSLHLAGKTGTTNDLRDSWFVGLSGEAVTAVW